MPASLGRRAVLHNTFAHGDAERDGRRSFIRIGLIRTLPVTAHASLAKLRHAVQAAYRELEQLVQRRLQSDGYSETDAHERAQLAIALFEGGAMLSQGLAQARAFGRAVEHAARICAPPAASSR